MAFDGLTTAGLARELNTTLSGGGISRIVQTEKDELLLTVKSHRTSFLLLLSASASLPLAYLTDEKKEAPLTAPNFCMLLRKHLQGGQILSVTQPSLERILIFTISHRNELGDLCERRLILELMGKHSNLIFTDEDDTIIDSIKRVPASMSSVREVLPGRQYFIPETQKKRNPLIESREAFCRQMEGTHTDVVKALYQSYTGLSPAASEEFIFECGIDGRSLFRDLTDTEKETLADVFCEHMERIRNGEFSPHLVMKGREPVEFAVYPTRIYEDSAFSIRPAASVSAMLRQYYGEREAVTRIRQKSADLRHLITTALDRTNKKYLLQEKQQKSTEKRDKYRIYGEMLHTYGYDVKEGASEMTCLNYYTNEPITVPLDPFSSVSTNAQRYFDRYNKLKRTAEALETQMAETENDREQLEAILTSVELAENESDLTEIRRELTEFGFASRKTESTKGKKREAKSLPYRFLSSDGFEILVGKNNYQNEELTFRTAGSDDWWFHAKGMPGSHVIVRSGGRDVPDTTFEEAGALAAYYSSGRKAKKTEVDYTLRRNLRKKNGGKPGFVIYHTNYSLMAEPEISRLKRL